MKTRLVRNTIATAWCCLCLSVSYGQIDTLQPNARLVVSPSTCDFLVTGTTQTFALGSACGGNILISPDQGLTFIDTITSSDIIDGEFEFTFDTPGEYVIFCNGNDIALTITSAACYTIADPVPTTSEWGGIILFLCIMNFSVLSVRANQLRLNQQ